MNELETSPQHDWCLAFYGEISRLAEGQIDLHTTADWANEAWLAESHRDPVEVALEEWIRTESEA